MARTSISAFSALLLLVLLVLTPASSGAFSRGISRSEIHGLRRRQKLSHLRFYFHDTIGGPNTTAVRVAQSPLTNSSPTRFGSVMMIDDPLTLGPDPGSKLVGRAQGLYASADMNQLGLMMAVNFMFTEGKFSGSTLSVLGRNSVFSAVREMPVLGGTGVFRLSRGYAVARTHSSGPTTAVIEYNVYVFHY